VKQLERIRHLLFSIPEKGTDAFMPEASRPGIARENAAYYPMDMKTISLKLPQDLLTQLEKEAKARGITKSLLVRDSLEKALRHAAPGAASCYELAQDLAGAVAGLPKDLAVNPKYMDGFGE
jgi:hypothetical protein